MIRRGQRITGLPYLIGNGTYIPLDRVDLESKEIMESTLQEAIANCPNMLPFTEVDESLGQFTHLCREFQTIKGPIDHLLLGEHGEISIVETKLWKNPEARRQVLGQIIDYSSQLRGVTFIEFESKLKYVRKNEDSLFQIYQKAFGDRYSEEDLIDSISDTLKQGSFVLLIVGDGIRTDVEDMKEFLDNFPGNLSTIGLVELRVYRHNDSYLFLPMLVQRTVEIGRTVVELKDERLSATVLKQKQDSKPAKQMNVRNKTYEQQTVDSIIDEIKTNFGETTAENAKYLFNEANKIDLEIRLRNKEHSVGTNILTENGSKHIAFIEIWNHWWAGHDYKLKDLQIVLINSSNSSTTQENIDFYNRSLYEIFNIKSKIDQLGIKKTWLTVSLTDEGIKNKLEKLFQVIQTFIERVNSERVY